MPAYKDTTKGTWYCKFRYKDWQGKTRSTTKRGFATRREAKQYEEDFISQASGSPTMTFETLCDLYLADKKNRNKSSTYANTERLLKKRWCPLIGEMSINSITTRTIREAQNRLLSTVSPITHKKLSPSYLMALHRALVAVLAYAVRYYNLPSNPAKDSGHIGKSEKRLAIWTPEQYQQFYATLQRPIDKLAFDILYTTGIREGELMALTPADIDIQARTLTVNKSLTPDNQETTPKNKASYRVIHISQELADEVESYLQHMSYRPDRIIDISRNALRKRLQSGIKKTALPPITIHGFRHSHASLLLSRGAPVSAIAKRMGHSSPNTTLKIYSHALRNDEENLANLVSCGQNVVKHQNSQPES